MALVLILLALLGFTFAAVGGSGGPSLSGPHKYAPIPAKCAKRMHAEPSSSRCRPPANP